MRRNIKRISETRISRLKEGRENSMVTYALPSPPSPTHPAHDRNISSFSRRTYGHPSLPLPLISSACIRQDPKVHRARQDLVELNRTIGSMPLVLALRRHFRAHGKSMLSKLPEEVLRDTAECMDMKSLQNVGRVLKHFARVSWPTSKTWVRSVSSENYLDHCPLEAGCGVTCARKSWLVVT